MSKTREAGAEGNRDVYMQSRIWREEAEAANPFAARASYCHGYDVFGDMLGRAHWADMIYLLFRGEAPSLSQAACLDILAVALANPGPREPSVHAAMCAGVGGSPSAAALMAALAVGAGSLGGSREIALAMEAWALCGKDLAAWGNLWVNPPSESTDSWPGPAAEHPAGFDPHGVVTATPVKQTLAALAACDPLDANEPRDNRKTPMSCAAWLQANLSAMEKGAGHPLALTGVAAAAFVDLGFTPDEGEMLYLLLRLPGAAAHALEQRAFGHKKFPFYRLELEG